MRAPVAEGLLDAARGLAADVDASDPASEAPLRAHERFVAHLEAAAASGDPDPAIGGEVLAAMMGVPEAMAVDLGRLADARMQNASGWAHFCVRRVNAYGPGRARARAN